MFASSLYGLLDHQAWSAVNQCVYVLGLLRKDKNMSYGGEPLETSDAGPDALNAAAPASSSAAPAPIASGGLPTAPAAPKVSAAAVQGSSAAAAKTLAVPDVSESKRKDSVMLPPPPAGYGGTAPAGK